MSNLPFFLNWLLHCNASITHKNICGVLSFQFLLSNPDYSQCGGEGSQFHHQEKNPPIAFHSKDLEVRYNLPIWQICVIIPVLCLINKHVGKAKTSFGFYAAAELSQSQLSSHYFCSSQHISLLRKALKKKSTGWAVANV